ncbi:MAG: thioredoxin family protein [Chitinophagaceae bacterium]
MKQTLFSFLLLCITICVQAQQSKAPKLYHPEADAEKDVQEAIAKAAKEKKFVLLQMGGNWCGWCIHFNKFVKEDPQLDSMVKANFVVYHLNYSPENKNEKQFAKYGYPQRFGFPVFVVLDAKGNRIHTQNSVYLEEGDGYNKKRVMGFFRDWSPKALDPAQYESKGGKPQ